MADEAGAVTVMPWHASVWQGFLAGVAAGRVPHALLLAGPAGIGKRSLADAMIARLLCEQPIDGNACGRCRGCRLRLAGSHPDIQIVEPAASGQIPVAAARSLSEFTHRTSQHNSRRIALLTPAEAMNRHTENALLKTLEEPPDGMTLILISHQPGRLAATVRSRCQVYRLGVPPRAAAVQWLAGEGIEAPETLLALSGGCPLRAGHLAEEGGLARVEALAGALLAVVDRQRSAVQVAADWQSVDTLETVQLMQRVAAQLMRGAIDPARRLDQPVAIGRLQSRLDADRLRRIEADLRPLRDAAEQPLSRALSLEALFLIWSRS